MLVVCLYHERYKAAAERNQSHLGSSVFGSSCCVLILTKLTYHLHMNMKVVVCRKWNFITLLTLKATLLFPNHSSILGGEGCHDDQSTATHTRTLDVLPRSKRATSRGAESTWLLSPVNHLVHNEFT